MTFPIPASQYNALRGIHTEGSTGTNRPTSDAPALPRLPPPSPNAASPREVATALSTAGNRLGSMITSSSSPAALMMLLTEVTRANESGQLEQIAQRGNERHAANETQQAAIQQAIEEQGTSSFWSSVTKVLSYVGAGIALASSIAAAPFSGGTSILAGVCAFTALAASATTLVVQIASDCGANIPFELTLTLACVGAAAGLVGGIASLCSATTQTLSATTRAINTATSIAQGVNRGISGVATGVSAYHASEATERRADATQAESQVAEAQYRITSLLDGLSQNESVRQRLVKRTINMESNRHETVMQTIRG